MSGTTFLSDPCYLPIYKPSASGVLKPEAFRLPTYTDIWRNFLEGAYPGNGTRSASVLISNWNGKLINDVIVFDTEQDKMWFILRWS
jgi:hypothetical protein